MINTTRLRTIGSAGVVAILAASMVGCTEPTPAPEGLDNSVHFLFREFYGDDETVSAGLTGLMNWFDEQGDELLDERANLENAGAFSVEPLEAGDVTGLPLTDDGRDLRDARGVIALAEIDCSWDESEALMVRADQAVVFEGENVGYERRYLSSRGDYELARQELDFSFIDEQLDVIDSAELGGHSRSLLLTDNDVFTSNLGVQLDYQLALQFRHRIFDIGGQPTPASLLLSFVSERAVAEDGNNTIEQTYGIEAHVSLPSGNTLRVVVVWVEVDSVWLEEDSNIVLSRTVNSAQSQSERLSDICTGDVVLPEEA